MGLILVAAGSSYYHWNPNNQTLVWDRLPMTICFMSLFVALLGEHISFQYEKIILPASLLLGVFSVIYWQYTGDLRFYGLVQFGTLAAIPLILLLYRSKYAQFDTNGNGLIDIYDTSFINGFVTTNIAATKTFYTDFDLQIGANNLLDYTDNNIPTLPGIQGYIRLNYQF
jgi:hypothetical protein